MTYDCIRPGALWLDTDGRPIQAHGFSVFYSAQDGLYYWYGENKEKTTGGLFNRVWHWGVRCYSSPDLYNWTDRGLLIPPEPDDPGSPLHPAVCMDRPHILFCARTGKYVAWLKIMCGGVRQFLAVLQADAFLGPYTFVRRGYHPLQMNTGDFTLAQDRETGRAYLIFDRPHFELVTAELTEDYTAVTGQASAHCTGLCPPLSREAPVFFAHGGRRYLLTSGSTGYFPNPSRVHTFTDWHGAYTDLGDPCVGDGTGTSFYSQFTCVLPVPGRKLLIAMADRWKPTPLGRLASRACRRLLRLPAAERCAAALARPDRSPQTDVSLPRTQPRHFVNTSAARYVWLPVEWEDGRPVIRWRDTWRVEDFT